MASVSPSSAADPSGEPILTLAMLMAVSRHIGLRCEAENLEFLKCKKKDPNPEKCLDKGQQVTRCILGLTERNVEEDEEINMSN